MQHNYLNRSPPFSTNGAKARQSTVGYDPPLWVHLLLSRSPVCVPSNATPTQPCEEGSYIRSFEGTWGHFLREYPITALRSIHNLQNVRDNGVFHQEVWSENEGYPMAC